MAINFTKKDNFIMKTTVKAIHPKADDSKRRTNLMKRTIFSTLTLLILSTLGGYDLVTFNAVATGTLATPRMDGNYQTWHLPDGAIARLGKGGIVAVAFSSADQRLIVASEIGVWLYDVATSRELALLPTESRVGAFFTRWHDPCPLPV